MPPATVTITYAATHTRTAWTEPGSGEASSSHTNASSPTTAGQ